MSDLLDSIAVLAQARRESEDELKRACLNAVASGETKTHVADTAGIPRSTLNRWIDKAE